MIPKERFKLIASVYLLFIQDEKILLMRRKNTGFEDGNYGVPSGHLEDDESLTEAMCREAKEEIGVLIQPEDLQMVHVMHRKQKDIRLDFFFTVKKFAGEVINCEPEKCDDLKWFPLDQLPSNTIGYVKHALENYLESISYSEVGWS